MLEKHLISKCVFTEVNMPAPRGGGKLHADVSFEQAKGADEIKCWHSQLFLGISVYLLSPCMVLL